MNMNFLRKTNQIKKDNLGKKVVIFDFSELSSKEKITGLAIPKEGGFSFYIKECGQDLKFKYQLMMTSMHEKEVVVVSVETESQAKEALDMIKKEIVNPWGGVKKWSWIVGIFVLLNLLTPNPEASRGRLDVKEKVGTSAENYDELKQVQEMIVARQKMLQDQAKVGKANQDQQEKAIKDLGNQLDQTHPDADESLKLLGK